MFHVAACIAASLVLLTGAVGLIGWILDIHSLKGLFSQGLTIKFNAALGLLLLGGALLLRMGERPSSWREVMARSLAAIAGFIGALTLLELLTGWNLLIDELIYRELEVAAATSSPNRMGPPAALVLVLGALGIWYHDRISRGGYRLADFLGGLILVVGAVPLIGHAYGSPQLYGLPGWTNTAFHTAVAMVATGIALIFSRPNEGIICIFCEKSSVAVLARRLVLPVLLFPLLVGWVQVRVLRSNAVDFPFIAVLGAVSIVMVLLGLLLAFLQNMRRAQQERTRTEAQVLRGREQLATALSSANAAAWEWDVKSGELSWSRDFERPDATDSVVTASYESWLASIHVEDREIVDQVVKSTLKDHEGQIDVRYRIQRANGEVGWVRTLGKVYYDAEGEPLRAMGIARDMTGEQLREEELRRTAERLELMYLTVQLLALDDPQKAADGLVRKVLVDLDCQVYLGFMVADGDLHMRLETYAGIDEQQAASIAELPLSSIVCGQVVRHGTRIVIEDVSSRVEDSRLRHLHALGVQAYVCHPLLQDGRVIGTLGFGSRTVRRFSLENLALLQAVANHMAISIQQARAKRELARAMFARGEFVAAASHELRKPLAPILSGAEIIELDATAPPAVREIAGMIRRNAETQAHLISHLLDVLRSRREAVEQDHGQGYKPALPTNMPPPRSPLHILLVDGHADAAEALARLLMGMGHEVQVATSIREALRVSKGAAFDVLLSEEVLEDGDGAHLLEAMQRNRPIHGIVISGYGAQEHVERSRQAGFAAHLIKPVTLQQLSDALAAVAAQREALPAR